MRTVVSQLFPFLTHYQTTNFRLFQTERVADDNFSFDENGRKLSKRVENTVVKRDIARYEQFLLFPQRFQISISTLTKMAESYPKQ